MTFNVDIHVNEIWVKTFYAIEAGDEYEAQQIAEEMLAIDFYVDAND